MGIMREEYTNGVKRLVLGQNLVSRRVAIRRCTQNKALGKRHC